MEADLRKFKPNLLDPIMSKKISKVLNPPKEDYWGPTKGFISNLYQNYIKPNIFLTIFIIVVLLILLYRYITIKRKRKSQNNNPENDHVNYFLESYNEQKERSREPKIKELAYPIYPYNSNGVKDKY